MFFFFFYSRNINNPIISTVRYKKLKRLLFYPNALILVSLLRYHDVCFVQYEYNHFFEIKKRYFMAQSNTVPGVPIIMWSSHLEPRATEN